MQSNKAAVLFTGGKDSCLALYKAKKSGYDIKYLLCVLPASQDAYMFHKPDSRVLKAQAKALEIPMLTEKAEIGEKNELRALKKLLKKVKGKVKHIITGGIASQYQSKNIEKICKKYGLEVKVPLWHLSGKQIWQHCLDNGFKIIICKIASEGLGEAWLGKIIDSSLLKQLESLSEKYKFDLSGEGGDFESLVIDMPLFREKIKLSGKIIKDSEYRYFFKIKKLRTTEKNK